MQDSDHCPNCNKVLEGDSVSTDTLLMFGLFFCDGECLEEYVESK